MEKTTFCCKWCQKYIISEQKIGKSNHIILKNITVGITKEAGLNGYSYDFRVDYNTIDVSDIVDIHKNLRKKCSIK